jgi:hypothetical protein
MAKLSREEIRKHAATAGFAGSDLNIAVAVALAESGGRTDAHNATPPDDSYGLWQINMLGSLGPDRRQRYGLSANTDLYDPATNARVAKGIHAGSGWKAWTTYTRGTYKQYMDAGSDPSPATDTPATPTASSNPVTGAFNAFGETVFKAASNFAGLIVAVVLLALGVLVLSRNALPAGKVLKAVGSVKK